MSDATIHQVETLRVDALYGKKRHFNAADRKAKYHFWLGLPAVIINIAVGTVLFALLAEKAPEPLKWIGAFLALVAALLTGIQTYFNYERVVQGHRRVASEYLAVAKECSRIVAYFKDGSIPAKNLREQLESLAKRYHEINKEADAFPTSRKDYLEARKEFKIEEEYTPKELQYKGE